jgi:transcriptional regulator with AAA-type ATPase domain
MVRAKRSEATTADRCLPAQPSHADRQPALIVAYPRSTALLLPPFDLPVGRQWLVAVDVPDPEASASHLVFRRQGRAVAVEDVGSRNGTWVDGEPIEPGRPVALVDGTVLRLGRTVCVYREALERALAPSAPLGELVGPYGLHGVARAVDAIRTAAPPTILIEGETGTGKELLARHLAAALGRAKPYTAVNLAAVAQGVFESQLFGHVAGAFSGARVPNRGVLCAHDNGTVFLDEISALPLELQPKLLRVVENRDVLPVGSDRPEQVDVLLLTATNCRLDDLVAAGTFRADLAARLKVWRIAIPPLRQRAEDLLAIVVALGQRLGRPVEAKDVEPEALERLMLDPWAANVRGLLALLVRLGEIDPHGGIHLWAVNEVLGPLTDGPASRLTHERVQSALAAAAGSEREAARRLGVSRGRLRRFRGES